MDVHSARLRVVLAVADEGSFSAAARKLHLAQPSISRTVAEVERDLGFALFKRGSHAVEPTRQGSQALIECRRLIDDVEIFAERMAGIAAGEVARVEVLAMHSLAALIVPAAVRRFRAAHPRVTLTVSDHFAGDIVTALERRPDRLAFTALPPGSTMLGSALGDRLRFVELMRDDFVLIRGPRTRPEESSAISWSELAELDVVLAAPESTTGRYTRLIFESHGIAPRVVAQLRTISAVFGMIAAGVGAAIVPATALHLETFATVVRTPLPVRYERRIGVVEFVDAESSVVQQRLIDEIRAECAAFSARIGDDGIRAS